MWKIIRRKWQEGDRRMHGGDKQEKKEMTGRRKRKEARKRETVE